VISESDVHYHMVKLHYNGLLETSLKGLLYPKDSLPDTVHATYGMTKYSCRGYVRCA